MNTATWIYNKQKHEEWKPVPNFSGFKVSDLGNLVGIERTVIGKNGCKLPIPAKKYTLTPNKLGYVRICLKNDDLKIKNKAVHHLVLEAFGIKPEGKIVQVNHKNGIKHDNRLLNLEWTTCAENIKHSYQVLKRNLSKTVFPKGTLNKNSKLTESDIYELHKHLYKGNSLNSFAVRKGVSRASVRWIVIGKCWTHLKLDWSTVYSPKLNYSRKNVLQ